ncbi:MAG: zinc ABC transporter substrate-binding protein, partial [Planctomycetota bacterium]
MNISIKPTVSFFLPQLALLFGLIAIFLVSVPGCASSDSESDGSPRSQSAVEYPIECSATIGMVAELVRNIGGEHVAVNQLIGSGVDPHLHKASRDDVQDIMAADMVFYCGLLLEGRMTDALERGAKNKPVIAVTERIDESTLLSFEEFDGHFDPHVWNDVSAWSECAAVVAAELAKFDPEHASEFQENLASYQAELGLLHDYGLQVISSIPEGSRVLITSHDAFNYFGRAYGLDVMGVQGLSTESEAGLQRINELVDLIIENDVKAVFIESSVSPKNIQALIEGAKSRGHDVSIG